MKSLPSIFNDVIGPIMRGPSSSHTAASWRVGKFAVQLLNGSLLNALVEFDKNGAWSTNYREQGTVLGMNGGLLEIDMADDQMKITEEIAERKDVKIEYSISEFDNTHPNSMLVTLKDDTGDQVKILAASLGGGSFEIQKVDDYRIHTKGDYYHLFIWSDDPISQDLSAVFPQEIAWQCHSQESQFLIICKSSSEIAQNLVEHIRQYQSVRKVSYAKPIMPIVSGNQTALPFDTISSLIQYSEDSNLSLGALGLMYEQHRSGLTEDELILKMSNLIELIETSIAIGLNGTDYNNRILPQQSHLIKRAENSKKILQGSIINKIVENVAAIMESKSALEVIVANPTAGSCATVGAALKAVSEDVKATEEEKLMSYFAAGLVGAYFAMGPGFSAEEHGCQVECGASAGMAAAAIVELFGGTTKQALGAASMAIQNMIGLVCDPIADRVEAPCLGKNTSAAVNALSSATMAVAGFAHLIPLDQVLETIQRVSADMPTCVKCTGLGGLAITPAAQAIKKKLSI
ncbi:L-serine ammonia-lyase, iron-sulfur-dependent, subunit alpha [Portibacter marinus]|uniref:L-serine ammonia-lyase, iron-sulfur-dependent, subunit alpha n=1 Tax=Portibacter marinus TaxID=2898660 RepID=UPI001F2FED59|nr:L-serine ammonia-lyase, iron-sulfur-dependent, subunit alpha [Portibacter marinus]